MLENKVVSLRQTGVGIPLGQQQPAPSAGPKQLVHLLRAETYGVQWTDDEGTVHQELMHFMGGVWYRAPNGENYARSLRPLGNDVWLTKALVDRRQEALRAARAPSGPAPADEVDVVGSDP